METKTNAVRWAVFWFENRQVCIVPCATYADVEKFGPEVGIDRFSLARLEATGISGWERIREYNPAKKRG
jgi:hypothetical protein